VFAELIESSFQLFVWFKAQPTTCVGLAIAIESQQNPECNRVTSHTEEVTAAGQTDRNVFIVLSGSNYSSELVFAFSSSWSDEAQEAWAVRLNLYRVSVACHLPEFPGRDNRGKPATRQGQGIRRVDFLTIVKMGGVRVVGSRGLAVGFNELPQYAVACGWSWACRERVVWGLRRGTGTRCLAPAEIAQNWSLPVFRLATAIPELVPVGLDCIRVSWNANRLGSLVGYGSYPSGMRFLNRGIHRQRPTPKK